MADNVTVRPSEGGIQVATDEVDGVHVPIYKLATGVDGVANVLSSSTPLTIRDYTQHDLLRQILVQQKITNAHLALMTEVDFVHDDID